MRPQGAGDQLGSRQAHSSTLQRHICRLNLLLLGSTKTSPREEGDGKMGFDWAVAISTECFLVFQQQIFEGAGRIYLFLVISRNKYNLS